MLWRAFSFYSDDTLIYPYTHYTIILLTNTVTIRKIFKLFLWLQNTAYDIPKWWHFSMPKQDKEKTKIWDFGFFDTTRFTRSEQAGNPLFGCALLLLVIT